MTCDIGSLSYRHVQELAGSITSFTCNATQLTFRPPYFTGAATTSTRNWLNRPATASPRGRGPASPALGDAVSVVAVGGGTSAPEAIMDQVGLLQPSFEVAAKLVGSFRYRLRLEHNISILLHKILPKRVVCSTAMLQDKIQKILAAVASCVVLCPQRGKSVPRDGMLGTPWAAALAAAVVATAAAPPSARQVARPTRQEFNRAIQPVLDSISNEFNMSFQVHACDAHTA